jgi:type IV pilus assembly protein PilQ
MKKYIGIAIMTCSIINPVHFLWAFDDTVFDITTTEDLTINQNAQNKNQKSPMVLEPDLVDAGELPTLEQPNVMLPPPVAMEPSVLPDTLPEDKDVKITREDSILGTEDLDIVGTDLQWDMPDTEHLPSPPALEPPEPKFIPIPIAEPELPAPLPPMPLPEIQAVEEPAPIPIFIPEPIELDPQISYASTLYDGPIISAYLVNMPLSDAIKAIAYTAEQRVIVPEEIPGRITINVEDKDWKWIIDSVLRSKPYIALMVEGTLVVSENVHPIKGPPVQHKFHLNHVLPSTLADRIKPFLTKNGKIFSDDAGSTLILHDAPTAISMVTKIIQAVDLPHKKILIEAKLVEMEDEVAQEFGINWSLVYQDNANVITGTISNAFNPSTIASRLGVATTRGNVTLTSFLDLLETSQKVKVVSSPRVVTLNNITATLGQSDQFIYPTEVQGSAGTSVGYSSIFADTMLKIKPRIVSNDGVEMAIDVKRAYPNDINNPNLPQKFQKQSATTLLVVKNGETAVIGGLKAQRGQRQKQGIPILKDIPLLGYFFGNDKEIEHSRDLMIFIQPKIL